MMQMALDINAVQGQTYIEDEKTVDTKRQTAKSTTCNDQDDQHPRWEPIWGHAIFFTYSLKCAKYVKVFVWLPYPFRKRKVAYVPAC